MKEEEERKKGEEEDVNNDKEEEKRQWEGEEDAQSGRERTELVLRLVSQ